MRGERPQLRALAERLGIASSYWDLGGRLRPTADATREVLVAAMGHEGSSEAAAATALAAWERAEAAWAVDPVVVWREYAEAVPSLELRDAPWTLPVDYALELRLEDGARHEARGRIAPGERALALPIRPPFGYHDVHLALDGPGGPREARQRFVMAPRTALGVDAVAGAAGSFGIWTNLYTVRSRRSWGFGDFGDLAGLLHFVAAAGGAFVGVNPLHAVPNRGLAVTPYGPSSRCYRNLLYLDVEAVPELAGCAAARARLADPAFRATLARLRAADCIDHEAVLDAKLAVLRQLHASFRAAAPDSPRAAAYAAFCAREGRELVDFATWEVLADHFAPSAGRDWRRWPARHRDPASSAVAAFRRRHAEAVAFRCWLQFELDEQLGRAAARGREAGLAIGLYQDLAIGSAPDSADTWVGGSLFASGAAVGAPPDDYAPEGQNWGFPPIDPHRLRASGYRAWTRLLRAGFGHAGALRIDHAMGMLRLFWIPEGRPGSEGTYVYQRVDDLLGILALESRRSGALAIAEDLGTVPPGFRERLADWGVLSSAVLYFEREGERLRPASAWSPRALATVETHDLVPLAGHAEGVDLAMRRRVGAIPDDEALAQARAARAAEHDALLARLREDGLLPASDPSGAEEPDAAALCEAVHAFLARTPAALVAASLDDLAGEREPVNLPGVPMEQHRSWSRRMRLPLEALVADPAVARTLEVLRRSRSR